MCRKTDELKIWTLNNTVLIHKRFLRYGFLKEGKRLMFKHSDSPACILASLSYYIKPAF